MWVLNVDTAGKTHKDIQTVEIESPRILSSRKNTQCLEEIVRHFEGGMDIPSCLLALELIFTTLLKDREMLIEVVPLKPVEKTSENQYKEWLKNVYEECYTKMLQSIENGSHKIQVQGLSTAMNILSYEGKFPLEAKDNYVPLTKLKAVLMKILSNKQNNAHLINKYTEYLLFDDILFFTWKVLPSLTAKIQPK
ncbi:hypothetical protein NQ317_008528 [Molorchus minor]|uniref:Uncharacterized protein n=1 Tax=Molorchus minor TaxID=1323400 RepID=A0ABQ9J066_9CUCU|nr:hypothetical protein NQ317_008528 [Molorchus minor]